MAIRKYKPTTPGRRFTSVDACDDVTCTKPLKSLITIKKQRAGRSRSQGKITVRHRGGGAKRYIRIVDFKQDKFDIPGTVKTIEYDPNRNARIALVVYADGEKRYILAPHTLAVGDVITSSKEKVEIKIGNRSTLENIPTGVEVCNVELRPGRGGQFARSAGLAVRLMAVEGKYAQLRLPSGEIRLVPKQCLATIGSVSNPDFRNIRIGKAGRKRHMGIRPTVRGKVMNPCDHPHGGGEGSNPIGLKHPKTPWGKPALGRRTRRKKQSDVLILKRRKTKKKR